MTCPARCPASEACDRVADAIWCHTMATVSPNHIDAQRLPHGWNVAAMLAEMIDECGGDRARFAAWADETFPPETVDPRDHGSLTVGERNPDMEEMNRGRSV